MPQRKRLLPAVPRALESSASSDTLQSSAGNKRSTAESSSSASDRPCKRVDVSVRPSKLVELTFEQDGEIHHRQLLSRQKIVGVSQRVSRELVDTDTINVKDVSSETAKTFLLWLETGEFEAKGLDMLERDNKTSVNTGNMGKLTRAARDAVEGAPSWWTSIERDYDCTAAHYALAKLMDIYLFSKSYEMPGLTLATIIAWQRLQYRALNSADQHILIRCIEQHSMSDNIVNFSLQTLGYNAPFQDWRKYKHLPGEFLFNMLGTQAARWWQDGDNSNEPDHDYCKFHSHASTAAKNRCQNSRPQDYDMISKGGRLKVKIHRES